jgi:hypothetical protein
MLSALCEFRYVWWCVGEPTRDDTRLVLGTVAATVLQDVVDFEGDGVHVGGR